MHILNKLVNLLIPYVEDVVPIDEAEIRGFAQKNNILFREDHMRFLMKIGRPRDGRVKIFHRYGGDFDFYNLVDDAQENYPNVVTPTGSTYFGTNFVGEGFCIDYDTGKIHLCSANVRYGVVHETVAGFLLECLLPVYNNQAFSKLGSEKNMSAEYLADFRRINQANKLNDATRYALEGAIIDHKKYLRNTSLLTAI